VSAVWTAIAVVAVLNFAIKATGPIALGGRPLPPPARRVVALLAPALLAALVVVDTFSDGHALVLDARLAGLGAAALALTARAPLVVVVLVAPAAAAAARALGSG
jgi:branched-subunit amino acid transport protein